MITQHQLKEMLTYDMYTGLWAWTVDVGARAKKGQPAGSISSEGYVKIKIAGRTYAAHRLAWVYMTGVWPDLQIDHVDMNRRNNSWRNLREADDTQNRANTKPRSACGCKGVQRSGSRWTARITIDKRLVYIGTFDTKRAAAMAYADAAAKQFGSFARLA